MAKYLNLTGLQTLWEKIKSFFALKENGVYYVPGTSGYANWSANTAYAVGANVVNPSGECWTCKTAHTSGSSWSSTNWNRISAVALTGTIDGVTALYAGLKIAYRFQVLGGEGSTTLNVNNLGAKTITRGTGAFYRWTIGRYGVAILVYDGSAWRFGDYDSNDQHVLPDAYCSTAAGTQAKAATSIGFSYSRHNNIPFRIYFTNANTYNGNLTLNVNSQGAKPLWINGSASSSSNKTIAIGVYWCYYDGTQFQLWTDKSLWAYKYRGDGSNLTETFTAASSRANIASGESNATIFGKIAKWLSDLKALAFKDKVGVGDVESGTYGISISGSAGTANTAKNFDSSEGTIQAGFSSINTSLQSLTGRVGGLESSKVDVANISLSGQTTTILAQVKALASEGVHYARFYTASDGGSSSISDKPTGTTNAGFVLEAYCNRYISSSDWRYVVLCYVQAARPKIAWITNGTTSISWQDLNTNTDTKVTQTADNSSTGTGFEVLFSATADNTTRTEASRKSNKLTFQPSTGTLAATKFSGTVTADSMSKSLDELEYSENYTINDNDKIAAITDVPEAPKWHRKKVTALWDYIKGKISSVLGLYTRENNTPYFSGLAQNALYTDHSKWAYCLYDSDSSGAGIEAGIREHDTQSLLTQGVIKISSSSTVSASLKASGLAFSSAGGGASFDPTGILLGSTASFTPSLLTVPTVKIGNGRFMRVSTAEGTPVLFASSESGGSGVPVAASKFIGQATDFTSDGAIASALESKAPLSHNHDASDITSGKFGPSRLDIGDIRKSGNYLVPKMPIFWADGNVNLLTSTNTVLTAVRDNGYGTPITVVNGTSSSITVTGIYPSKGTTTIAARKSKIFTFYNPNNGFFDS